MQKGSEEKWLSYVVVVVMMENRPPSAISSSICYFRVYVWKNIPTTDYNFFLARSNTLARKGSGMLPEKSNGTLLLVPDEASLLFFRPDCTSYLVAGY